MFGKKCSKIPNGKVGHQWRSRLPIIHSLCRYFLELSGPRFSYLLQDEYTHFYAFIFIPLHSIEYTSYILVLKNTFVHQAFEKKKNGFKRPLPPPFPLPLVAKSLWDLRGLNISHGHEKEESESLNTKRQNRCKSCVIRTCRSLCHGFLFGVFFWVGCCFSLLIKQCRKTSQNIT